MKQVASMKVLITGANGMLGTDLQVTLQDKFQAIALGHAEFDITNIEQVGQVMYSIKPDIVINTAAYTNVDGCETNKEDAFRINALGPRNLAAVCENLGARLVQVSTDYVFDGRSQEPYDEFSRTSPISIYGESKLAGEELVKSLTKRYYVVRTAWLYGKNGNNFVKTILKLAQEREYLTVVNDQIGSPTYTKDLAKAIGQLISQPAYGIYHFTNSGYCSWYEFAKEILEQSNIGKEIKAIKSTELRRPAPRPSFSKLNNFMGPLNGVEPLRDWRLALKDYLEEMQS